MKVLYFCSAQENGEVADHRGAGHPAVQGCPERHPARGAQGEIRSRIQEDSLHMFEHGWCLFWGGAPLLVGVKKETKWKRKRGLWFKRWFSHIETNPHVTARPWPHLPGFKPEEGIATLGSTWLEIGLEVFQDTTMNWELVELPPFSVKVRRSQPRCGYPP